MKKIYKLTPSLHNNIWGGVKLKDFGKESDFDRIGESWELSFVEGNEALVDGITTGEAFGRDTWGENCRRFDRFPVLTKFIDARENLSVQVHPSDEYALQNEGQYGKTEMWYVVEAEEGAGLYMGLSREASAEEFEKKVKDGTVEELLSFKKVSAGDVFFIEAGTIHAIGGGVLIFEIQQNSTLTYRLYDYKRVDKFGNERELHVDKAMKVSSLAPYSEREFKEGIIGECSYFRTKLHKCQGEEVLFTDSRSYESLTAVSGCGTLSYFDDDGEEIKYPVNKGDSFFVPAGFGEYKITGELTFLTVTTPEG